jgi:hypothetical protein
VSDRLAVDEAWVSSSPMFTILSTCKGGGYRYARTAPPHPRANAKGLYPLHRVLAENALGRLLAADEDVHHRDGNKANNSIENLEVVKHGEHAKLHNPELDALELTCPCGARFSLKPRVVRLRLRQKGGRALTCSRSCGNRYAAR